MDVEEQRQLLNEQEAQQARQEERATASQLASQAAMERGTAAEPGYWDAIGDPDIKREEIDDEHLSDFAATEFSDKFAFGNITYSDWESWTWAIENEFWTMQNEFQDQDSKLDDIDVATMYGEVRPELTNERARRLRSAQSVKKMMSSLSVGARGLKSGTEIHAVAKTERPEEENEDGGILSGVKKRLV